jgi:hypothetical protein
VFGYEIGLKTVTNIIKVVLVEMTGTRFERTGEPVSKVNALVAQNVTLFTRNTLSRGANRFAFMAL